MTTPTFSILACAHDRIAHFAAHMRALSVEPGVESTEYCVGIWGDATEHRRILERYRDCFADIRIAEVETEDYWPLPKAYNAALRMATCPRVLILGTDVVIPQDYLPWIMQREEPNVAWVGACRNEENGQVFVGQESKGAFPYCMGLETKWLRRIRGWDETFGEGIVWDDVDLCTRLLLAGVRYWWNLNEVAIHQSHPKAGTDNPKSRSIARKKNYAELLARLHGYPIDLIWPLWWPEGPPPKMPHDNGLEQQDRLAAALRRKRYPIRARRSSL